MQPELHVVAGPNGAGKTTIFRDLIPQGLDYVNADLIAKTIRESAGGLNAQDIANREASQIFYEKVSIRSSFAIETNLVDVDTYKSFQGVQQLGYKVSIYFLTTDDVNICIDRVKQRVAQGGHNVNPDIINQRYKTGLALLKHYKDFPDVFILFDNTEGPAQAQLELRKGIVHYQFNPAKKWVTDIMDKNQQSIDVSKAQSAEEVRRAYKKSRGR